MHRFLFSKLSRNYFGTAQIADWEYVSKIHKSLKHNNINEAMKYLINSHLDGIVLDRQTFYNMHLKMNEAKAALSYQQLAYKLYRESFSPHPLIIQWMKMLEQTKDKKTLQFLKKDYQALGLEVPNVVLKKLSNESVQSTPTTPHPESKKVRQTVQQTTHKVQKLHPIQIKTKAQKNPKQEKSQKPTQSNKTQKPTLQLKRVERNNEVINNLNLTNLNLDSYSIRKLQEMVNLLSKHDWKIVIHNLQLEFDDDQGEMEEGDLTQEDLQQISNEEIDKQDENYTAEDLLDAIRSAKKIKIEKIQISQNSKKDPNSPQH